MSILTGKEALIALAEGKTIENWNGSIWWDVEGTWQLDVFLKTDRKFRLKPRTISINGIEVPAPFLPEEGELFYHASPEYEKGYSKSMAHERNETTWQQFGAWRTEEEIKQVVAALRQMFGGAQ